MKRSLALLVLACTTALGAGVALSRDDAVDSLHDPADAVPSATLSIRVRDARDVPVDDATVVVSPAIMTGFRDAAPVSAAARGEGFYDARLAGGDWRIVVTAPGGTGERRFHVDPGGRAEVHVTVR